MKCLHFKPFCLRGDDGCYQKEKLGCANGHIRLPAYPRYLIWNIYHFIKKTFKRKEYRL